MCLTQHVSTHKLVRPLIHCVALRRLFYISHLKKKKLGSGRQCHRDGEVGEMS